MNETSWANGVVALCESRRLKSSAKSVSAGRKSGPKCQSAGQFGSASIYPGSIIDAKPSITFEVVE
ncbi:hypothetical protein F441_02932 [Phytophthora nicotianae CJ01A1]|uniref:Uncharacterized protein n=4 Tax=Phytophthora nicotianae TaxID=4792 RepID=V9FTU0_PHYNI|nr:hypothetical protein F443_02960 [Phytophthora nicotianae P1569]ETO82937.1 hypothetical protein F444_02970 [Phytophthora nicotianae P1976]ETP24011.1 hypothetical protein F441_02932 [Phytophthora nicotianae CJ01A1]ETP52024.1 hypothetical protein F442_02908 [Phytophthora nicotianae P10297]